MKTLFKFFSFITIYTVIVSCYSSQLAYAKSLDFLHKPVSGNMLPAPGQPMQIEFLLPKTKDLSLKARAWIVIDGKGMDLTLSGSLNDRDQTVFRADIRAPLTELIYQIFISGRADQATTSMKYIVTRPCLPNTILTDITASDDLSEADEARMYAVKTKSLEKDIEAYSNVVEILNELKEVIK